MSYRELDVWKRSMDLVVLVYEIAGHLPNDERFALSNQLKRASVSIPSNPAEGQRRYSKKEMVRFAGISLGSAAEIETQLLLCRRLYKVDVSRALESCEIISRMILALIKSQKEPSEAR